MDPRELIDFLHTLERLKCNTRHSWTTSERHESVAEHSWRLAVMAMLMKDEFPAIDMGRVLAMCLVHDWGEAITGDITSFMKTDENEATEDGAIRQLIESLPASGGYQALFDEMKERSTAEAKLWKALDMLEALMQHNEADLSTWLPLEEELQLTYGQSECAEFEYTKALRKLVESDTLEKLLKKQERSGS